MIKSYGREYKQSLPQVQEMYDQEGSQRKDYIFDAGLDWNLRGVKYRRFGRFIYITTRTNSALFTDSDEYNPHCAFAGILKTSIHGTSLSGAFFFNFLVSLGMIPVYLALTFIVLSVLYNAILNVMKSYHPIINFTVACLLSGLLLFFHIAIFLFPWDKREETVIRNFLHSIS